jgi:hypothetical protein
VDLDGGAWLRVGASARGCMSQQAVTFPAVLDAHTTSSVTVARSSARLEFQAVNLIPPAGMGMENYPAGCCN